ncbi:SLOG family protein [Saliterribacillus persicus]|uniref:Putative phage-like protein YoqJ n=1 Tax=Saliterribacillus persicus TaxID=930114 RepID=A0A368XAG9_9BACI|nr:SLOG family protein [Saliterribacillus persicus]RCW64950.1 putative phage-like protein YoqJ [Saliterribacillus persicus]
MKVATLTGNKPNELQISGDNDPKIHYLKIALEKKILSLIDEGLEWLIISGQMGVELWAAEVVLDLKQAYDIKLGIFPPFLEFESRWPESYQQKFLKVKEEADFYKPIFDSAYKGSFQFAKRDQWLIEKSDGCIILGDEEYPGSMKFFLSKIKTAQQNSNYQLAFITPFDLEEIVREEQEKKAFED